jgi:DNA-binding GntR family transcriptional regulator
MVLLMMFIIFEYLTHTVRHAIDELAHRGVIMLIRRGRAIHVS